eukprot:SAG22_NODE_1612_length_3998_cov_12.441652_4_plen_85_part_00
MHRAIAPPNHPRAHSQARRELHGKKLARKAEIERAAADAAHALALANAILWFQVGFCVALQSTLETNVHISNCFLPPLQTVEFV